MSRWVRIDRRYNQPIRLTGYAWLAIFKWGGLSTLLLIATILLASTNKVLALLPTVSLISYVSYRTHLSHRQRAPAPPAFQDGTPLRIQPPAVFNLPPGWPPPPAGWRPQPGWQPDPAWPAPPPGWQLFVPVRGAVGERLIDTRYISQAVKDAVYRRDGGRCVQCGSVIEIQYDHKIPWSRGGTNTVNNIQLLCGPCNRRKGAKELPTW